MTDLTAAEAIVRSVGAICFTALFIAIPWKA